jgi:hypothetical protein
VGAFLTAAEVDAIFDPNLRPAAHPSAGTSHAIGLDLGLTRDRTVAAVAHRDSTTGHVVVDTLRTWIGTPNAPVDLPEVEGEVRRLARLFLAPIVLDPYQGVLLAQRLRLAGIRVEEQSFTGESRRRLFGLLLQLVKDRHLRCFAHHELRLELLSLEVTETTSGWRVDHRTGHHDDHAVAVALAAQALTANPQPIYGVHYGIF